MAAGETSGYVGRSLPRLNADRWVRGRGRYVADVHLPGERTCAILRSTEPHARLRGIDTSRAQTLAGVILVVTGADLLDAVGPHGYLWDLPGQKVGHGRCLAVERVRYVGEPVAAVVAGDRAVAEDALELIEVDYEPLPLVNTVEEALAADPTLLHEEWGDNVHAVAAWPTPAPDAPPAPDVDVALEGSHLVVRETFASERIFGASLETRGVVADYEAVGPSLTVYTSTQSIHQIREGIAQMLGLPEHRIRVIAPDVGGAFGAKAVINPEEALVPYLAMRLRRPVRWIETRAESYVATQPSRSQTVDIEMGFEEDGRITALRARTVLDIGAAPSPCGAGTAWVTGATMPGPYVVPAVDIEATAVVTNKTPLGAYRGYGQPEAVLPVERVLDMAARRLQIDPAELRRRNLVDSGAFPFATPTGLVLDSGRYVELLDLTLERLGWDRVREQAAAARAAGRLVGVGLAFFNECTNFGPTGVLPLIGVTASGWDSSTVRVEPDGHVRVITSQTPMGQGIETVLAQTAADALGVRVEDVSVAYGDTLVAPYTGYASGGSRGAGVAGSSVLQAADKAADKLRAIAAHQVEASPEDIELVDGGLQVRGSPSTYLPLSQVARTAYVGGQLPPDMEPGLELTAAFDPPGLAFSYGVVSVVVEIDRATGAAEIARLVFGHDCGRQLNPAIVAGQIVGGAVQGIGAALYEALPYDEDGRPLVQAFNDYLVPTARELPQIDLVHIETSSPFSLNGAKGVGEGGVIAVPAAILNALQDALPEGTPELTSIPVWPRKLLDLLDEQHAVVA